MQGPSVPTIRRSRRRTRRSNRFRARTSSPWRASRFRSLTVGGILILAILALAGRLAYLQLYQGQYLATIAEQQQTRLPSPRVARRFVVDVQGNMVAMDGIVYELYAHPALFKQDIDQISGAIAPTLEVAPTELAAKLRTQATGIKLSQDLPESSADRIRALRIDGLELIRKQQRIYPQQDLFASVVGFVNLDGEPQLGVELSMNEQLSLSTPQGDAPAESMEIFPKDYRLRLTLDSQLQRIAQKALETTVTAHQAKRGTLIIMEADSGAIRAFANAPSFDPNRYYSANINQLKNWAVSDLYEPGSTFKSINLAIALEVGAITPETTVYDSGQLQYGEWTIRNSDYASRGAYGTISVGEVLAHSTNIGMVQIMKQLRAATYYDWLEKIGLDQPTGIDLPAEATGQMKDRSQFINSAVESATTAFGQGFAITPIQLIRYQAAIANGGRLVTPHVVDGIVDTDGDLVWQPDRAIPTEIFSPTTAAQVMQLMEQVVAEGTGEVAQLEGYRIAGKTGTAQKATAAGVYGAGKITSFTAIIPAEAPQYVILAVIDEPKTANASGSTVAAPLVKQVMEPLLVLEGIPPVTAEE